MEFASGEKYVKFFLLMLNFLKLVHSIINSVWWCFDRGTVSHKPGLPASVVTSHSSGKEASLSLHLATDYPIYLLCVLSLLL